MSNPLLIKKYYIIETPAINDTTTTYIYTYNTNKSNSNTTSYDSNNNIIYFDDILEYNPKDKTFSGLTGTHTSIKYSMDIYQLSKYISDRLVNFISQLQKVNRCNKYGSSSNAIPSECSNTFNMYDTSANIKIQITNISNNKLPLYKTLLTTGEPKKHLQQQLNDIKNLITRFNAIIMSIKDNNLIPTVDYNALKVQSDSNMKLRSELDLKLAEIYEYDNSKIVQSREHLDSTVYTGVLWSILATSLAYFVFVKL